MEKKNFFKTKEGRLTKAFLVIMVAFILILVGLQQHSSLLNQIGFVLIMLAMLWSPVQVYVIDKMKNKAR